MMQQNILRYDENHPSGELVNHTIRAFIAHYGNLLYSLRKATSDKGRLPPQQTLFAERVIG